MTVVLRYRHFPTDLTKKKAAESGPVVTQSPAFGPWLGPGQSTLRLPTQVFKVMSYYSVAGAPMSCLPFRFLAKTRKRLPVCMFMCHAFCMHGLSYPR